MRYRLISLCAALFIAAGCSGSGENAEKVREHYMSMGDAVYTATLRTDFGDRVLDFDVEYTRPAGGGGKIVVLAPELIAGIEAGIGADGVSLSYDGLMLELGALPGTGLSPMESLPFIVSQWSAGYVTQTGEEKRAGRSLITVTTRRTENGSVMEVRSWFDGETLKPVTSELSVDGFLTVTAIFE
jgi:outer membrane lipoprotein-sorting protein